MSTREPDQAGSPAADVPPREAGTSAESLEAANTTVARAIRAEPVPHRGAGTVLAGRYRLVRELGDGGMGDVFVAENLSIGCLVAIKVLKPEWVANESFRRRFQKEAEAVAAVQHANVVRFLDLVVGDPTFLVMEYVEGPTLATVLKRERSLSIERAVELTRRLCWGLEAAHRAGVVHRDVKPSNVILAPDPETGEQPKLIDFGVAKIAGKQKDIQLTRHGQIVGTPHYMSPEQITGGDVDARSDVYSLGCLFYHMVAGRPPFVGVEEYQILSQHVEQPFLPASSVRADVPVGIDRIVQRALAKDPQARFGSMQEMARALAVSTTGADSTEAATKSMPRQEAATEPRRKAPGTAWLVAAVAFAAAVAGAGGWLARGHRSAQAAALVIASSPEGANIEVDGRKIAEVTPAALPALPAGEHVVELRHDGRADVERRIVLRPRERELVDVTLPPKSRRVSVRTAPPSAAVYLDGHLVAGTTPTFMTVTEDDFHEVRIERAGYETLVYALKPEDRRTDLEFTLDQEREPRGTISVDSNGVAEVWLDGVFTGFTTPTLDFHVPVGTHTIELRDSAGVRSAPHELDVKQGESVHLTLSLVAGHP